LGTGLGFKLFQIPVQFGLSTVVNDAGQVDDRSGWQRWNFQGVTNGCRAEYKQHECP
jgi:hypothetical protein